MPVGSIYKLLLNGLSTNSDPEVNTLHYIETIAGGVDDELALASGWQTTVQTQYLACIAGNYELTSYGVYRVFPTVGALVPYTTSLPAPGTVGTSYPADNVSIVLTKRTGLPYRSGRGRIFLPGVPTAFYVSGKVSTAAMTPLNSLCSYLTGPITAGGFTFIPVVFNKRAPLADSFWNPINQVTIDLILRQQRRRETGVRIHPRRHLTTMAAAAEKKSVQVGSWTPPDLGQITTEALRRMEKARKQVTAKTVP